MSVFLDKLMNYLGYEKIVAQSKPTDYPNQPNSFQNSDDKIRILDPQSIGQGVTDQKVTTAPEQLTGDPRLLNPEKDIQQHQNEQRRTFGPFDLMQDRSQNSPDMPTDTRNINEEQIKVRPILNVEDIDKFNHNIAIKMQKLGILTVDKEMFMEKYDEWYKQVMKVAAMKKKPISEVFDELL